MTTPRPGFIWSGSEWVPIGSPVSPVSYQPTAPTAPATGDVWIDSDGDPYVLNSNNYVLKADVESFVPHNFLTMGA